MLRIGVLSDTHGFLDPQIPKLFSGVHHILHGGDIGLPYLILELEEIAPVTAVLGNVDAGLNFQETEIVELAGRKIFLHHIVDLKNPRQEIHRRIERVRPDLVIFGHTHRPCREQIGPTCFLNPGYAGKPRFNLPRTVAVLSCDDRELQVEFHNL